MSTRATTPAPPHVPAPPKPAGLSFTLRLWLLIAAVVVITVALLWFTASTGQALPVDPKMPNDPTTPTDPTAPVDPSVGGGGLTIDINGPNGAPSSAIVTIVGITLLSVAPALLLMMTSFTKIFVVLAMTRNALALPSIPPNQVLAGLALFLSLFIMAPVLTEINTLAVAPYLDGTTTFADALAAASAPLQQFMMGNTREEDLALMTRAADQENPASPDDVPLLTLIPAFMISELRAAFIIGFVIFIPFLVIDIVVSAALMSMGMMMLPPVMISLPFKILLFILVDGWGLIITSLVGSYRL
ncbi:flagellar type III secretion system pore protein FliP [Cryobacterium sp. CG_9.6]|uniref:flagellar type III secretion system pore protein FliP n=1 Tax=Cryobacterium sp. CG_9.6 TaxID=2760710 RepID=UPI002476B3CB|nr:flagellar type III secretion system pore protein FliP [Cryobacterium sp. CG_9.6]MDH6237258.1 flagellar biosynthetic protein FliP [Cryobacterium sp. CG_9.6]